MIIIDKLLWKTIEPTIAIDSVPYGLGRDAIASLNHTG